MLYYYNCRWNSHRQKDRQLLAWAEGLESSNIGGANLGKMDDGPGSLGPGTKMNRDLANSCGNPEMRLPSASKAFFISSSCGKG